jgi:hypothetical protein
MPNVRLNAFFNHMKSTDELLAAGFKLLEKRDDALSLFSEALERELFALKTFLPHQPTGDGNSYKIPLHPGLAFLKKVAVMATQQGNGVTIGQLVGLVKGVSAYAPDGHEQLNNMWTWGAFTEIVSTIPDTAYDDDLISKIRVWLETTYDRGFVAGEISSSLIPKLLKSENVRRHEWLLTILSHMTEVSPGLELGKKHFELLGLVEPYWLKEMFDKHAQALGEIGGRAAVDLLIGRLREIRGFGRLDPSSWTRSAIEDHEQNTREDDHEDVILRGCRDVLIAWLRIGSEDGEKFVTSLATDDYTLLGRLALHAACELSPSYDAVIVKNIDRFLGKVDVHHEIYRFISERFNTLMDAGRAAVLAAVRRLHVGSEDAAERRALARQKFVWIECIQNASPGAYADDIAALKQAWPDISVGEHPDLLTYHESWHGPGDSVLTAAQILGLLNEGNLINTLNGFEPSGDWRAPTLDGLCIVLQETVAENTDTFVEKLDVFLDAKSPFQYALIKGLIKARQSAEFPRDAVRWEGIWRKAYSFLGRVFELPGFWTAPDEDGELRDPKKSWIPGVVADFLMLGLRENAGAIPIDLRADCLQIINASLQNVSVEDSEPANASNHALGSAYGRTLECLVTYSLYILRTANIDDRRARWEELEPYFRNQLAICQDHHFDASATFGRFLAHFLFLSSDWVTANIERIFPIETYPRSFVAALSGFAYCNDGGERLYKLIQESGVLSAVISTDNAPEHAREKAYQRIALAILWGIDRVDGETLKQVLNDERVDDLSSMVSFLSRLDGNPLREGWSARVTALWRRLDAWSSEKPERSQVGKELVGLLRFLPAIDQDNADLVLRSVTSAPSSYNAVRITDELSRLFDSNPRVASEAFFNLVRAVKPMYDQKNGMRSFLEKVVTVDRVRAIATANELRGIAGMPELQRKFEIEAR